MQSDCWMVQHSESIDLNAGQSMVIDTYPVCMTFGLQVRQYPRVAFTDKELDSSLEVLGLTSKQEVLLLELI